MDDSSFTSTAGVPVRMAIAAVASMLLMCAIVYNVFFAPKKKDLWTMVPGGLPYIGHLHLLARNGLAGVLPQLYEWADKYGAKHGAFEVNIHLGRLYVICSEERLLELNKLRPMKVIRDPTLSKAVESIGGGGLLTAEGKWWSAQRRTIAPCLNRSSVSDYLGQMKMVAGRLVQKWEETSRDGSSFAVNEGVFAMMADVLSINGYGMDMDLINTAGDQLGNDVLKLCTASIFRTMSPFSYWNIPLIGQYLDGMGFRKDRVMKLLGSYVDEYAKKKEHLDEQQRRTFLGKIFEQTKDEKSPMTREDMMGNLFSLFVAGTDTNSQSIMFALWKIASDDTGLQEELVEEMRGFDLANCSLEDFSTQLPRLKSLMHEIHRFYGGFPLYCLNTSEEIEYGGKLVPPDTPFLVLPRYPSISKVDPSPHVPIGPAGEQPHEFCPRRFLVLKDDAKGEWHTPAPNTTNNASFLAFGMGARSCPGRIYSEAMASITLVALLQKFQVSLEAHHEPIFPVFAHIDTMNCDLKIHLKQRRTSTVYEPPVVVRTSPIRATTKDV